MRQLVIPRHGPPDVLTVCEAPEPAVEPGTVRIRVRAAGINFSDLLARQGLYPEAPRPPCVIGYEVAGTVDAVGPGVTTFEPGRRVMALTRLGGQRELVIVPATRAYPLPDGWSFEQGAAFPVVYLTAHHLLVRVAAAQPGESVLVHSAAGGVGLAVIELGRLLRLRVIGVASPAKHEVLRSLGVEPVDGTGDWPDAVRRVAPAGVDVVLDAVGGASWRKGYALLAPAGRLLCFGASELVGGPGRNLLRVAWRALRWPRFGPRILMQQNRTVAGVNLGRLWDADHLLRPQIEALLTMACDGHITPRVDRAFPLEEAAAAHQYMHERRNIGKVVLTID